MGISKQSPMLAFTSNTTAEESRGRSTEGGIAVLSPRYEVPSCAGMTEGEARRLTGQLGAPTITVNRIAQRSGEPAVRLAERLSSDPTNLTWVIPAEGERLPATPTQGRSL